MIEVTEKKQSLAHKSQGKSSEQGRGDVFLDETCRQSRLLGRGLGWLENRVQGGDGMERAQWLEFQQSGTRRPFRPGVPSYSSLGIGASHSVTGGRLLLP
jgi:hypothetical protein